jgi:hypothetical protein
MPPNLNPEHLLLERGDTVSRVWGGLTAVRWKDKQEVYVPSNTHIPPAEDNLKEGGRAVKRLIVEDYTTHIGYVDSSDRMANSYSVSKKTWKWMEKLFFHLLDLTILNSYILYKFCGGNMTHLKFREQLARDLIVLSHKANTEICGVPRGQPGNSETQNDPT